MGYMEEINPSRGEIVIIDSEQLAPTRIISLWGAAPDAPDRKDNRNVPPWASNGYAKKGVSLILNQAAAKWVGERRFPVGSFYVRSGRNFSAGWASRSSLEQIIDWPHGAGFKRIRYRARRSELKVGERRQTQTELCAPARVRVGRTQPRFPGKCVEWCADGGSLLQSAIDKGAPVEYLYPRHTLLAV